MGMPDHCLTKKTLSSFLIPYFPVVQRLGFPPQTFYEYQCVAPSQCAKLSMVSENAFPPGSACRRILLLCSSPPAPPAAPLHQPVPCRWSA